MKKAILMLGLFLAFAGVSFGQTLAVDAKPACGTVETGTYATYEVAPASDPSSGYAGLNEVPLGFRLCGTYSTIVVTMATPVPAGETDNVLFGIYDGTTEASLDCAISPGGTTCSLTSSASFGAFDDIYFVVYIPGEGHSGYTVQNLTWTMQ